MPKRSRRSMIEQHLAELVERHGPEAIMVAARNTLSGHKPDLRGFGLNGCTRDTARRALALAEQCRQSQPFPAAAGPERPSWRRLRASRA